MIVWTSYSGPGVRKHFFLWFILLRFIFLSLFISYIGKYEVTDTGKNSQRCLYAIPDSRRARSPGGSHVAQPICSEQSENQAHIGTSYVNLPECLSISLLETSGRGDWPVEDSWLLCLSVRNMTKTKNKKYVFFRVTYSEISWEIKKYTDTIIFLTLTSLILHLICLPP